MHKWEHVERYSQRLLDEVDRQLLRGSVGFGEVFASSVCNRDLASGLIRDRQLGDSAEAQELIPVMTAVDTIFLQDGAAGSISPGIPVTASPPH